MMRITKMIIDTSVFIAFYDKQDPKHQKATELIRQADEQGKLFISDYIINETATVALRKMGIEKAKEITDTLINSEKIIVGYTTQEDFKEIVEIFKNQNDSLSFVDCSIILMAKSLNMEVASFDKNLLAQIKHK
ncbi:MAG: PIN domain-containing protein [Candidatus Micrarchaeota archaeon]